MRSYGVTPYGIVLSSFCLTLSPPISILQACWKLRREIGPWARFQCELRGPRDPAPSAWCGSGCSPGSTRRPQRHPQGPRRSSTSSWAGQVSTHPILYTPRRRLPVAPSPKGRLLPMLMKRAVPRLRRCGGPRTSFRSARRPEDGDRGAVQQLTPKAQLSPPEAMPCRTGRSRYAVNSTLQVRGGGGEHEVTY